MSQTEIEAVSHQSREAYVVDTDLHFDPGIDDLLPYISNAAVVEKLEQTGMPPFGRVWHPGYSSKEGGNLLDTQGKAVTGEDVVTAIDEVAVDVPIVTPGMNMLPEIQWPTFQNGLARALNDYVLDEITPVDDRIKAMLAIPHWDTEATVAELDRHGDEADFVGAYGWFGPYDSMGMPRFDPIFEKLIELDLPLVLHGSGFWSKGDPRQASMRTWAEAIGVCWPVNAIVNAANMIFTGVFDKYPELNVVYQESGLLWIPFFAHRLDEFYQDHPEDLRTTERMSEMGKDYLDRLPSEYLFEHFSFSTQPMNLPKNSRHKKAMLELCHADETFMFSSDWPHHTMDVPDWVFDRAIDDEMRERILSKNAEAVFRL